MTSTKTTSAKWSPAPSKKPTIVPFQVNIGRTSVELTRREMIGDEYFKVGDPIKVYIQEVKEASQEVKGPRGPQIEVTRSSEGFLKRLFEEEIHEIYDGTVVIKGIAREAGVRSKVAVYSTNEDVDPTGACIGPGGSRIQKIVSQLGNGKDKEKIDIISWSSNPGLYIAESLRPSQVLRRGDRRCRRGAASEGRRRRQRRFAFACDRQERAPMPG
jgi:N utilization substance protein A